MSGDPTRTDDGSDEQFEDAGAFETNAIAEPYKVLGEIDADTGIGVVGNNVASSGTPVGVEGRTPNASGGYGLYTPDDARIEGTAELPTANVDSLTVNSSLDAGGLVGTNELASGAVDSDAIASSAVTTSELASGAVDSDAIAGGAVTSTELALNSVKSGQIDSGAVTDGEIATDAVGNSELKSGAVDTAELKSGAVTTDEIDTSAVTSTEIADGTIDTADLGQNGASDGHVFTWKGGYWGTDFPGTSGSSTFKLLAGGDPGLRLEPKGIDPPNVVAGAPENKTKDGIYGGTISGGGNINFANVVADVFCTVGGGKGNVAGVDDDSDLTAASATVCGGRKNVAKANRATVAGGQENEASGGESTVGGGVLNTASADNATVPGGYQNVAAGDNSLAAGSRAKAADGESFVWNDGSRYHDFGSDGNDDGFSSSKEVAGSGVTGFATFNVSASGGVRFVTSDSNVTYISSASSSWSSASSASVKTNVDPVDPREALESVDSMDVSTWEYVDEDGEGTGVRHVGPMAEDFHDELPFEVGDSDEHINSINADGLAFAAIKGLSEALEDRDDRIDVQAERIEELEAESAAKDERIADLEDRLSALESRIEEAT